MARTSRITKKMHEALLSIMQEKDYLDITVSDLTRRAGVARASFYRHYNSVADVVDEYIKGIEEDIMIQVVPVMVSGNKDAVIAMLTRIFDVIHTHNHPVLQTLRENRQFLISKIHVGPHLLQRYENLSTHDRFAPALAFHIILTVGTVWAELGYNYSSEDVARYTYWYIWRKE